MQAAFAIRRGLWAMLTALLLLALVACGGETPVSPRSFVGKWKSSKLETPLFLYENGEWEIKQEDGSILQYGVWEYRDGRIIWSFKVGAQIGRDANAVVSVADKEFRLREGAQLTVFQRLDE